VDEDEETTTTLHDLVYLPKMLNGAVVLVQDMSNTWRTTNDELNAHALGLGLRRSKDLEAGVVSTHFAPWGEALVGGHDEGDGWVRFSFHGTGWALLFFEGDTM
jgi:hypothetical protein